jgi:hypothetical protein
MKRSFRDHLKTLLTYCNSLLDSLLSLFSYSFQCRSCPDYEQFIRTLSFTSPTSHGKANLDSARPVLRRLCHLRLSFESRHDTPEPPSMDGPNCTRRWNHWCLFRRCKGCLESSVSHLIHTFDSSPFLMLLY